MRTKIAVAVTLVFVLSVSAVILYLLAFGMIGSYVGSSNSCLPAFCSMQAGMQNGQQIIMDSYNFPVGGPLTVNFRNTGAAVENLAGAQYSVCPQDSSPCLQGTLSSSCSNASLFTPGAA
jgi:hypothetical protein